MKKEKCHICDKITDKCPLPKEIDHLCGKELLQGSGFQKQMMLKEAIASSKLEGAVL